LKTHWNNGETLTFGRLQGPLPLPNWTNPPSSFLADIIYGQTLA